MRKFNIVIFFCLASLIAKSQSIVTLYGRVVESNSHEAISNVSIKILNSNYGTPTKKDGTFRISIPRKKHYSVLITRVGFDKIVREINVDEKQDSVNVSASLSVVSIDTISVFASLKPDTLVGSPNYSVYDFDFYEDKYVLLTAEKSLAKAELKLADGFGKIITTYAVPKEGGEAKEFYKDYMGFTNLVCKHKIYRISLYHDRFVLMALEITDVNTFIKPIVDTINGKLLFTDYWKDYPLFNYYSFNEKDSTQKLIHTIEDPELMHAYNFEYYSLPPKLKLEARKLADELNTDKRVTAALMTGFTNSLFYKPLYAPLYVITDTITVFDHYKDLLFHIDRNGHKLDSIKITYNHPKNWKEWKHKLLKDDIENTVFALYEKNGHKYLKQINTVNGKELGKYTLQFHSADKLKIHNGYVYYIYRPFESTQQKFFYRELIKLEQ